MPGIFPEDLSGGLVIRDPAGNPTNPNNVQNAYVPPPSYVVDCPPTALPSDCTARITAAQINAIVSEMLSLAVCLDADGPWNCNSLTNLCAAFANWVGSHSGITISETPPNPVVNPFWYDSSTGILYVSYNDGNTTQFVQANAPLVDQVTIIGTGIVGRPLVVGVIDSGVY
jgi:hypothetical protein